MTAAPPPGVDVGAFPNTPSFHKLVGMANSHLQTPEILIDDERLNIRASAADLMATVLELRSKLLDALPQSVKTTLDEGREDVFVSLAAVPGYDWCAGYLAIASVGAAAVLDSPYALPGEMSELVKRAGSKAILFSPAVADSVEILFEGVDEFSHSALQGSNWSGGYMAQVFPILTSSRVEYPVRYSASWMWERIKSGEISAFAALVGPYADLVDYYQSHISGLPDDQKEAYHQGLSSLVAPSSGGAPLLESVRKAWDAIPGTRPIYNGYNSTECLLVTRTASDDASYPQHCIGQPWPGIEVRLSGGDEGEILIRSPMTFSRYLHDPERTTEAFDKDGFYKSGDFGRREGNQYFCDGRISLDTFQISATLWTNGCEVEDAMRGISSVGAVVVAPVPDRRFSDRVGAIVRPRKDTPPGTRLSLDSIRQELDGNGLQLYQLLTVLCTIGPDEEFPLTGSGKVSKKKAIQTYFPDGWWANSSGNIEILTPELLEKNLKKWKSAGGGDRMWDWGRYGARA